MAEKTNEKKLVRKEDGKVYADDLLDKIMHSKKAVLKELADR